MTRMYEYVGTDQSAENPQDVYKLMELPVRKDRYGQTAAYKPDEIEFMNDGACRDYDPNLFNTETNKGRTSMRGSVTVEGHDMKKREQIELAKSICALCPVLEDCSAFIKRYPEDEGVWAGTIPEERKA